MGCWFHKWKILYNFKKQVKEFYKCEKCGKYRIYEIYGGYESSMDYICSRNHFLCKLAYARERSEIYKNAVIKEGNKIKRLVNKYNLDKEVD